MGEKKQLTFYLPEYFFQDSKISAVRHKLNYSDFVTSIALCFCDYWDEKCIQKKEFPEYGYLYYSKRKKVAIYAYPSERSYLKFRAAESGTTLSNLMLQALRFYFDNYKEFEAKFSYYFKQRNENILDKKTGKEKAEKVMDNIKGFQEMKKKNGKTVLCFLLTQENDYLIRIISKLENTTHSDLISRWVKNIEFEELDKLFEMEILSPQKMRTSISMSINDIQVLKDKASYLDVRKTELINRLIAYFGDAYLLTERQG